MHKEDETLAKQMHLRLQQSTVRLVRGALAGAFPAAAGEVFLRSSCRSELQQEANTFPC